MATNRWQPRFDQPDSYDASYDDTNPQSFNRYAYVKGDPANFVDPTGLEGALTCLVDGMPTNCGTAFGLVSSGAGVFGPLNTTRWDPSANMGHGEWQFYRAYANGNQGWYNLSGISINVNSWVNGEFAGSASYYESFGTYAFGGNQFIQIPLPTDPAGPTGGDPAGPKNPIPHQQLPPCNLAGSGDIGGEAITPFFVGPKGGVQLDNKGVYPYFGLAAGFPGRGVAITGGPKPVSPGLNVGFSGGAAIAISYSAHIDWNTNSFRSFTSQLRNGSWQVGGQMPGASVNATVVLAPKLLQKNCQ